MWNSVLRNGFRRTLRSIGARRRALASSLRGRISEFFAARPGISESAPWQEKKLVRVTAALAVSVVLTVVATMKHDLRWLLWVAWALANVCFWAATSGLEKRAARILVTTMLAIGIGSGLYELNVWLRPLPPRPMIQPTLATQTPSTMKPNVSGPRKPTVAARPAVGSTPQVRSRSFIYVVPGVWSTGPVPRWIMLVKHAGPDPVFNIELLIVDKDRQAALSKKKSSAPQDIEAMERTLRFPEIDPIEGVWAKMFFWQPLNPQDEHYEVVVASREGEFYERLGVKKTAAGKWKYKMRVSDRESGAVLINCRDPEFPGSSSLRLPACFPQYVVGPKKR